MGSHCLPETMVTALDCSVRECAHLPMCGAVENKVGSVFVCVCVCVVCVGCDPSVLCVGCDPCRLCVG